jgi:putative ABC transport system substrate-binding protein
MAGAGDPVGSGLAAGIARPGGNVTGSSVVAPELVGKQLEILREVIPKVYRVALLGNPSNASHAPQMRQAQNAARVLGMHLQPVEAHASGEIDNAFAAMTRERAGAVIVFVDAMLIDSRKHIADLAKKRRLPAMYGLSDHTDVGGLMAYGPSVRDRFRRAATYVDKIPRGATPGDLPVEQPTKFEFVINLTTAKALGLAIPQSLLARADEVIR